MPMRTTDENEMKSKPPQKKKFTANPRTKRDVLFLKKKSGTSCLGPMTGGSNVARARGQWRMPGLQTCSGSVVAAASAAG